MSDSVTALKNELLIRNRRLAHSIAERLHVPSDLTSRVLPENLFLGILCLERKRAERSGRRLVLLTIDAEEASGLPSYAEILCGLIKIVNGARRETDIAGWYKHRAILAILLTEFGASDGQSAGRSVSERIRKHIALHLAPEATQFIHVAACVFADSTQGKNPPSGSSENPAFYPDLLRMHNGRRTGLVLKRAIDIVGSVTAILLLLPLFAIIAAAIKLTSQGPVLFRQERLGQFGRHFSFLKFRSMTAGNDPKIHQEFMKRLIDGEHDGNNSGNKKPVFKMTDDPRITPIGRILRRTSLDELPQFINVLKGEMSLVGPRPPIPYEFEHYDIWHRRRVLEVRPGITGLWQVKGRSRVCFDDMVRLDLQYAQEWSLWLDLQILWRTPRAVLIGEGAF